MASANFTCLTQNLAKADVDFAVDTFKLMLLSAVPSEANLDAWLNLSNVTTEITGTGYTAGGIACTASVGATDTSGNKTAVTYSVASPAIAAFTGSFVAGIIYKSTGTAANDLLCHMLDFGGTITGTGGALNITFTSTFDISR